MNSVPEQGIDALEAALAAGAPLLDVREADEWHDERIDGGLHIALGDVPARVDDIKAHISAHPADSGESSELWVVCAAGGRSMKAAEFLAEQGLSTINVAGGTKAWVASGKPFSAGPAE